MSQSGSAISVLKKICKYNKDIRVRRMIKRGIKAIEDERSQKQQILETVHKKCMGISEALESDVEELYLNESDVSTLLGVFQRIDIPYTVFSRRVYAEYIGSDENPISFYLGRNEILVKVFIDPSRETVDITYFLD